MDHGSTRLSKKGLKEGQSSAWAKTTCRLAMKKKKRGRGGKKKQGPSVGNKKKRVCKRQRTRTVEIGLWLRDLRRGESRERPNLDRGKGKEQFDTAIEKKNSEKDRKNKKLILKKKTNKTADKTAGMPKPAEWDIKRPNKKTCPQL